MLRSFERALALTDDQLEGRLALGLRRFLILCFATTAVAALYNAIKHHRWAIGDWLINYQGGFVRRGLAGEALHAVAAATGLSPGALVWALQVVCYGSYFWLCYRLLRAQRTLLPYLLLVVSPFVFTFQIYETGMGFRKEILFFVMLAFAVYTHNTWPPAKFRVVLPALLAGFPALILMHEMLAVCLPYLLVMYFVSRGISARTVLTGALLALLSVTTLAVALAYSGTAAQTDAIFRSLAVLDYPLDGGAISWLARTTADGLAEVSDRIRNAAYLFIYPPLLLLSAIAFVPVRARLSYLWRNKLLLALVVCSLSGSAALAAVAIDWNRFIYINLVALFLLSLLDSRSDNSAGYRLLATAREITGRGGIYRYAVPAFLLAYTQLWHLSDTPYSTFNAVSFLIPYIKVLGSALRPLLA